MLLKVIGVAFVTVVSYGVVKNVKPDLSVFLPMAAGAIILILLSDGIIRSIDSFRTIIEKSGVDERAYGAVLKIVGIGYITEFSANLCEDAGCSALAKKIELAGKITVLLTAMPIVTGVIDVIGDLM
ncbi:MAG: stage III sporulation protein AD [Clostridia bacterium]|nr:stage III sporulation protein AD [Clostridia bacterium]